MGIFNIMFDPYYMLLILAALIGGIAQSYVTSTYNKYRAVRNREGLTGFATARRMLDDNNLNSINVIAAKPGLLTDHYDPRAKHVALSADVYEGASIASVAIAAHEVGHAIQHGTGYVFIAVRNMVLPFAMASGQLGMILLIWGLFIGNVWMQNIGIIAVAVIALFQLVTLPVEFNASRRALNILKKDQYLQPEELAMARKVLTAAALTYVAALVGALLNLLYYINWSRRRR